MTRLRCGVVALLGAACLAAAGCGGGSSSPEEPTAVAPTIDPAPVALASVGPGERVRPGPDTPAPVRRALQGRRVIVIAFLLRGAADDQSVAASLRKVRRSPEGRGVDYFVYTLGAKRNFGDLPELLDVKETPTVVVIGRDRLLTNVWTGLVDAEILRQSISDAKEVAPAAGGSDARRGPAGSSEGIALAKKVRAAYTHVPGVRMTGTAIDASRGPVEVTASVVLRKGRVVGVSGRFRNPAAAFELVATPSRSRARIADGSCWIDAGGNAPAAFGAGTPLLPLTGIFSAPKRDGSRIRLRVRKGEGHGSADVTYVIDSATSRIVATRAREFEISVADLDAPPRLPAADPVCAPGEGPAAASVAVP